MDAVPAQSSLGIKPKELAADRGYYRTENVVQLEKIGIEKVGIQKVGRLREKKRHIKERDGFGNCNDFVAA